MKKVLYTGGHGFVGKNIVGLLSDRYDLFAPTRAELDLKDTAAVAAYLKKNSFDVVVNAANPNPVKNELDKSNDFFEDSMRIYMNFSTANDLYGKMLYFGSGAEYDKSKDICSISEQDCFRSVPKDSYGFAKYIMNTMTAKSANIYNLCLFACYGPYDHASKFITHCIRCCIDKLPITIRQDCWFDYIHVRDVAKITMWHIENDSKYHMYNLCSGSRILLSQIAEEVKRQMKSDSEIVILNDGFNNEYTASNQRFTEESDLYPEIGIEQGISLQIEWETEHYEKTRS